jgi:hypothetical protein
MGCGCGSGQQGEQWQAFDADGVKLGGPQTRAAATQAAAREGGWIKQVAAEELASADAA